MTVVLGPGFVRWSATLAGIVPAGFAVLIGSFAWPDPGSRVLGVAIITVGLCTGAWLVWRALRLGVVCESDSFVVRGLLWSRRIPLASIWSMPEIESVGGIQFIGWSRGGRRRMTPVTALAVSDNGLFSPGRSGAIDAMRRLEQHRFARTGTLSNWADAEIV